MGRKTLVLDSSQIDSFLTCDTLWNYRYNESIVRDNEVREDMAMGTYGHKLLEIYYTALACGKSIQEAVAEARTFHIDGEFPLSEDIRIKVAARFNDYWMIYCANDIIPALGQPSLKIKFGPHKSICDGVICDSCKLIIPVNGEENKCPNAPVSVMEPKPLVEQGFSYELLNDQDYLFVLEGRIDLIGTTSGQNCWMDHKFQGRKRDLYKKSIQFRNYSLVTDLSLGIINYIRLAKTIEKDTLQREIVSFPPWERKQWKSELIDIYKSIANDMDLGYFKKNRSSCAGKFGYACEYTKICEETNLVTIEAIKNQYYKKRERWSPW